MAGRLASVWLPRLLFAASIGVASALFALVMLAPLVDQGSVFWLHLFARDVTLRRTAIASAIGLAATASIFFRPAKI